MDSIWKLLVWTKIIFLTCKEICSTNIAHHQDLLFPSRAANGINTHQDMSVQKRLKSFHWGTGKRRIPRYWHTAHLYRFRETPHIHSHLFPNKTWMNKSEEKLRTFYCLLFRTKYNTDTPTHTHPSSLHGLRKSQIFRISYASQSESQKTTDDYK